jgi:hypothetical protein
MSDNEPTDQPLGNQNIGYRRPPQSTRFQKGQSGNPKGRPKGSLNVATVFWKTLREKVVINENGKRKKVTKMEASSKQLVNQAASGKMQALRLVFELTPAVEERLKRPQTESPLSSAVDQEVIQGILQRFQNQEEQAAKRQEGDVDDDQRG